MAINSRSDYFTNIGKGLGWTTVTALVGPGATTTAAAAASGNLTLQMYMNTIGSTLPGTPIGVQLPPSPPNDLSVLMAQFSCSSSRGAYLCWFYKFGSMSALTPTGDRFAHDAATFPALRTVYGAASQPITLLPIINVTTATTTTAAVYRLRTAAGGAGYVSQGGTSVVGTLTMTMPAAATTVNTALMFRLERGDSGVRDISAVEVTTAAAAGAADIWGAELICPLPTHTSGLGSTMDSIFGGLSLQNLKPAVATSGTLVSRLGVLSIGATSSQSASILMIRGGLTS